MGNPKKTDMEQHTRQKVAIYDAYLKRYLKIVSKSYSQVNLYDPCAGKGMYGDCAGSAVTACNNIRSHGTYAPTNGFHLYLNEPDEENRTNLSEVCSYPFVECIDNQDANRFITMCCHQEHSGHKLWFIDPYGYTQVGKASITNIMDQSSSEVLLFIPLTFIYRFLNGDLENDNKLKPVAHFLKDYSIAHAEAQSCSSPPEFADLISRKMQKLYGYSWHATMQEGGNCYSLVFISKHHYGLEKFLEARDSILKDKTNTQLSFIPVGEEKDFLALISRHTPLDNCKIYILGLKNGYTPSGARTHLESLEKRKLILVQQLKEGTRRKGSFFLGKKYFENSDYRIKISIREQQGLLF